MLPRFLQKTPLPQLDDATVHVWSGSLKLGPEALGACWATLSSEELVRAKRFKFEKDCDHFVAARGILRFLLGNYTGLAPNEVSFVCGVKGKPQLANGAGRLQFNVSHTYGVGAWALRLGGAVGVDVEWTRRKVDLDRVGKRFFSENEWAALANMPEAERRGGFFRCWTQKEAFVKALGDGLSFSLKAFDVSVGQIAEITRIDGDEDPAGWTMLGFEPQANYAGAVTFQGRDRISFHRIGQT